MMRPGRRDHVRKAPMAHRKFSKWAREHRRERAPGPRRARVSVGIVVLTSIAVPMVATSSAGAEEAAGVTSSSIKVGIPYVNLAPVEALGIKINLGSYPDAYQALIAHLNASGGINGRKVVPFLVPVSPIGTAPAATACTQLTQDDSVFAVLGPEEPLCYQLAGVPTVNGTMGASAPPGAAPNFALIPPTSVFDPTQIAVFAKEGIFKDKKVAVFAGSQDRTELAIVQAALKKQHVPVVQTAVDSAPESDLAASNQQIAVIAQRFKGEGVNMVVGVGAGAVAWVQGLQAAQSAYVPRLVATNYNSLNGSIKDVDPSYLKGAIAATETPPQQVSWNDPAVKQCVAIIRAAYPSDVIANPIGAPAGASTTWIAPENACQAVSLFATIAKAAGKNLSTATFAKSGYELRNVSVPGAGAPISFGPNQAYASSRPVYVATYDSNSHTLAIPSKPAS
jgi:Periplasmic binding protein